MTDAKPTVRNSDDDIPEATPDGKDAGTDPRTMTGPTAEEKAPVFAVDDDNRCDFATESGRRCKLVPHATGVHKFIDRSKKPVPLASVLPAGFTLKAEEVKKDDVLKREHQTAPRDADQVKIDADAARSYAKWEHHGKKDKFDDVPAGALTEYVVPPQAVDAVVAYLKNTVLSGGPCHGKRMAYRRGVSPRNGLIRVQWVIMDRPKPSEPAASTGNPVGDQEG